MSRLDRQNVYLRVARWAEELVLVTRELKPYPFRPIDHETHRFLEIRRAIARDQFNAAQEAVEEMES